jgi:hypothetical protein
MTWPDHDLQAYLLSLLASSSVPFATPLVLKNFYQSPHPCDDRFTVVGPRLLRAQLIPFTTPHVLSSSRRSRAQCACRHMNHEFMYHFTHIPYSFFRRDILFVSVSLILGSRCPLGEPTGCCKRISETLSRNSCYEYSCWSYGVLAVFNAHISSRAQFEVSRAQK